MTIVVLDSHRLMRAAGPKLRAGRQEEPRRLIGLFLSGCRGRGDNRQRWKDRQARRARYFNGCGLKRASTGVSRTAVFNADDPQALIEFLQRDRSVQLERRADSIVIRAVSQTDSNQ
jgi:hypothetical protein